MFVKSFASNMIIDLSYNMSKYVSINTFENCLKSFVYINARLDYTNIIALCRLDSNVWLGYLGSKFLRILETTVYLGSKFLRILVTSVHKSLKQYILD